MDSIAEQLNENLQKYKRFIDEYDFKNKYIKCLFFF